MKGIVYRRGRIIRPLLDVDRDCILKWLADHDLPYVQDSTNDTLHYTRNRIRNQLLPEIEQYVNREPRAIYCAWGVWRRRQTSTWKARRLPGLRPM